MPNTAASLTPRDAQRAEAVKTLFRLMAGGAGVGMFGRGLLHLMQPQTLPQVPFVSPGPSTLEIPAVQEEEPGLAKLAAELAKEALFDDQTLANAWKNVAEARFPLDITGITGVTGWLGRNVSDPQNAPMMMPLALGSAAAGTAGGWSLADWALRRRRKSQIDEQLQAAKDEFQAALLAQAQAAGPGVKAASEQSLSERLDVLYDLLQETNEKQIKEGSVADAASIPAGAYLTALGLLSAGSAYGMYNWTKNRSKAHLLDKALRERARLLWARSPQPVSVVPVSPEQPALAA